MGQMLCSAYDVPARKYLICMPAEFSTDIMKSTILFQAEGLPVLQNSTFATRAEALAAAHGDVQLVFDEATGLVRNAVFDSRKLVYDDSYQNEQSYSKSFQLHLEVVIQIIDKHFRGRPVIEIGCGKGHFLHQLRAHGYDAVGIDPAFEGDSAHVRKVNYSAELGLSADGLVLRHVLEHIDNPVDFLFCVKSGNGGKGLIYIEVPCFDWICQRRAWFDIFYEHVNYFRLTDFHRIFGTILDSGKLFGGQYIYVVADLSSLRSPIFDAHSDVSFPSDFLASRDRYRGLPQTARAIWGAASKGVIFAMHMQALGVCLTCAIDINPAKQKRYLPCSGLQVFSPQDALNIIPNGGEIFVMNSNYLNEIRRLSYNNYIYRVIDGEDVESASE